MSYPTIEDTILDDGRISQWLAQQMLETRNLDLAKTLADVDKLKIILNKRLDRVVKERKTFKTQVDLNIISF